MIRPMTAEDIVEVQRIANLTWNDMYEGLLPYDIQSEFLRRSYSDLMMLKRMEKTCMFVAECEGHPIGFINFTNKDEDGDSELTALYILPAYQHLGYGKKLLHQALNILGNANQLFVYIDGRNSNGRSFYEKNGFELLDVFDEEFEGFPVQTAQYVYYLNAPALITS